MSWHNGPMVAFDTETTGVDPEEARIVTACVTWLDGNRPPVSKEWLIDPGVEIPAQATAVHGITTEHARNNGLHPDIAIPDIAQTLKDAWFGGVPVVIMNASYDLTVLDRELRRHCGTTLDGVGPVIDPMAIDRALDKWRKGKRTLTDLCATYQVKLEGAHSAAGDCIAAARVAWRLAQKYTEVGDATLEELHAKQQAWRAEWATDFTDYLRKQGKDDVVDGAWPLRVAA